MAYINDSFWITEYLIDQEIDINQKDNFGNNALMYASYFRRYQIVEYLFQNMMPKRMK